MWPFGKKRETPSGLVALMDPTVTFVGRLHGLGGVGYVLLGGGLLFVLAGLTVATEFVSWLVPVAVTLVLAGGAVVVVWQILEYRLSVLKLRMILDVTQRMIDKKLASSQELDTAVIRAFTNEILRDVWGLSPGLLPSFPEKTKAKIP